MTKEHEMFYLALRERDFGTVKRLTSPSAFVGEYQEECLSIACSCGLAEVVERMLACGIPCTSSRLEESPLHRASSDRVASLLLDAGADVHANAYHGLTPLHMAASNLRVGTIKALLAHGANIDCRDNHGKTPLIHAASKKGNFECVRVLVEEGASTEMQDEDGRTPLFYAIYQQNLDTINLLLSYGANPNVKDSSNVTPVISAIKKQNLQILQALALYKADFNEPGYKKKKVMAYAKETKNPLIIDFIKNHQ